MGRLGGRTIERDAQRLRPLIGSQRGARYVRVVPSIKGWDGASNKASQTIDLQGTGWGLPSGIVAVSVYLAFSAANNNDYGYLEASSGDGASVFASCPDAAEYGYGSGIVNCDANGDIYFVTNNSTNMVYLWINGYFI